MLSTEGFADDSDCDPVPDKEGNRGSCLGYLLKEQTHQDELGWAFVSAGGFHSCAIRTGGAREMVCFGRGSEGQKDFPVKKGWSYVSAGWKHTCGILHERSSLFCWGDNRKGQVSVPTRHANRLISGWLTVAAGKTHTCGIILPDHAVVCWGNNRYNKTIAPEPPSQSLPASADPQPNPPDGSYADRGFVSVCSAVEHSCAVDFLGTVHCWGYPAMGRTVLPRALESRRWLQVACGGAVTCAIDTQHRLECWGANVRGHTQVPLRTRPVSISERNRNRTGDWDMTCSAESGQVCNFFP